MDDTSDQVARAVTATILDTGKMPDLDIIGERDAGATIAEMFDDDGAAWSGNPLFIFLGDATFFSDNIINDAGTAYNLMALIDSCYYALGQVDDLTTMLLGMGETLVGNGVGPLETALLLADTVLEADNYLNQTYGIGLAETVFYELSLGTKDADVLADTSADDIVAAGDGDDVMFAGEGFDILKRASRVSCCQMFRHGPMAQLFV